MDLEFLKEYNTIEDFLTSSSSSSSNYSNNSHSFPVIYSQPFLNTLKQNKNNQVDSEKCDSKSMSDDDSSLSNDSSETSSLSSNCTCNSDCSVCKKNDMWECIILEPKNKSKEINQQSERNEYAENISDDTICNSEDSISAQEDICSEKGDNEVLFQHLYDLYTDARNFFKRFSSKNEFSFNNTPSTKSEIQECAENTSNDDKCNGEDSLSAQEDISSEEGNDVPFQHMYDLYTDARNFFKNFSRKTYFSSNNANTSNISEQLNINNTTNHDLPSERDCNFKQVTQLDELSKPITCESKDIIKATTMQKNESFKCEMFSDEDEFCNEAYDKYLFSIDDSGDRECNAMYDDYVKTCTNNNNLHQYSHSRNKVFPCVVCSNTFSSIEEASNHCSKSVVAKESSKPDKKFPKFRNKYYTIKKEKNTLSKKEVKKQVCTNCNKKFSSGILLERHSRICKNDPLPDFAPIQMGNMSRHKVESSLNRHIINVRFSNKEAKTLEDFFEEAEPLILKTLEELYRDNHYAKIAFSLSASYRKDDIHDFEKEENYGDYFHHVSAVGERDVNLESVKHILRQQIDGFHEKGTGWKLLSINYLDMNISSRYTISHIVGHGSLYELPKSIKNKGAVINISLPENKKTQCFKYAVLCALHKKDVASNFNRHSQYDRFSERYNWSGITYPVNAEQIIKFQRNNKGIFINLFEYNSKSKFVNLVVPARINENEEINENTIVINILSIPVENQMHYHFCPITNLTRLLNTKNAYNLWCDRCIQPFHKRHMKKFTEHRQLCFGRKIQPVRMPKENSTVSFKNHQNSQSLTHVIYCDTECFLQKENNPQSTKQDMKHIPHAFGILLCSDKNSKHPTLPEEYKVFTGPSCIDSGLEYVFQLSKNIYEWNDKNARVPKSLSKDEIKSFNEAKHCYFCKSEFSKEHKKVQDHCHVSGSYRGASCSKCNLKMRLSRNKVSIFFHNLKNYDGHLIINSLAKLKEKHNWVDLTIIPTSSEKYISISCKFIAKSFKDKNGNDRNILFSMDFKDSALFLPASLDSLVKQLDANELVYSKKVLPPNAPIDLITTKGVFCYEYFDNPSKMLESKLPSRENFYDSLNQKECTHREYSHAEKAWKEFNCRTLEDYMLKYLELDVHQLADIFETFRHLAMSQDNLDPAHYFTLPGFSWDSALKMCKKEISLLSTYDEYDFVSRGIRGGMTFVNQHKATINSPELQETYNPDEPLHELLYVDANNLYGNALSMPLPISDFQWLTQKECSELDFENIDLEGDVGYLLEVDLLYPPTVQDKSEDLPFAPEAGKVDSDCLTEFQKQLYDELYPNKQYCGFPKLLLTHGEKKNYVVHGMLLKFYLSQGMVLQKVHNALQFRQEPFFREYITFNSIQRQLATSKFSKDFYKLKNNSLFGKTMENMLKRLNFKLVTNAHDLMKMTTKPSFQRSKTFSEQLSGVSLLPEEVLLNKPIIIGQAVLDLSKLVMYKWKYENFPFYEDKFGGKIRILGGDTDSFFLSVTNMSVYRDLLPSLMNDGLLDTSNYPENHPMYSVKYKADLRCIKDEAEGNVFKEFILLKPKLYAMTYVDSNINPKKRAKGVRRVTLEKETNYTDYFNTFMRNHKDLAKWQKRISSKNHQISTTNFYKRALSVWEDKRAWYNANESLPYGNHKLENQTLPKAISKLKKVVTPPFLDVSKEEEENENINYLKKKKRASVDSDSDSDDFEFYSKRHCAYNCDTDDDENGEVDVEL